MGYDVGAQHAWGVLLAAYDTPLCEEVEKAMGFANRLDAGCIDDDREYEPDSIEAKITKDGSRVIEEHFRPLVSAALASKGVPMPADAELIWTGDQDDRPGRCQVCANTIIVGYGMFRDPTKPIAAGPEFIKIAEHFNWVWGG